MGQRSLLVPGWTIYIQKPQKCIKFIFSCVYIYIERDYYVESDYTMSFSLENLLLYKKYYIKIQKCK